MTTVYTATPYVDTTGAPGLSVEDEAESLVWRTLTLADRCDGCGGAASSQVRIPGAAESMLFCDHHFRAGRAKFDERGYQYTTTLEGIEAHPYTFRSHAEPWDQTRDGGSPGA